MELATQDMKMTTKLEQWFEISNLLKEARVKEAELRRELCAAIIGDTQMENGRVTVKGTAYHLDYKASQALTYNIDKPVLESMWSSLSDIERASVVYKPSLSLTLYKKLPEDSLLHEAITTKLAMPTLTAETNFEAL